MAKSDAECIERFGELLPRNRLRAAVFGTRLHGFAREREAIFDAGQQLGIRQRTADPLAAGIRQRDQVPGQ
ncbi:MAG: hypothetical protein ACREU4_09760, partial [Burkholderiales bacterium]